MRIETSILDWIQSIRTPIGDIVMPLITQLGDAGAVWTYGSFIYCSGSTYVRWGKKIVETRIAACSYYCIFKTISVCALSY